MKSRIFNDSEMQFIIANYQRYTKPQLIELLNKRFVKNYNVGQLKHFFRTNSLKNGFKTTFKKGCEPHNKLKIGDEFYSNYDGYTYIKIKEPNTWIHKQRYMYLKYHGSIPKGYSVIFANQDKSDYSIDNLILVKDKDKLVAKNLRLLSNDKEITNTGLLVASLINKVKEKKDLYATRN